MEKSVKNRIITLSLREIKNSFKRFLSLLIISMLGVTVFVGIKATAPDMMNSIDKFYDENKGLFTSGADKQVSYASQVWMVLGNVIEPEMGLEVLHNVAAEKDAVEMVTPYIYHYYIEALLKCGAKDEALAVMKNYWGGMAELGADTFWELYFHANKSPLMYGIPLIYI